MTEKSTRHAQAGRLGARTKWAKRAESARKAFYQRMAMASAKARAARKGGGA